MSFWDLFKPAAAQPSPPSYAERAERASIRSAYRSQEDEMSRCRFQVLEDTDIPTVVSTHPFSRSGWQEASKSARVEGYSTPAREVSIVCGDETIMLSRCINEDECYLTDSGRGDRSLAGPRRARTRRR